MDQFGVVKTMSVRKLVGIAFFVLGVAMVAGLGALTAGFDEAPPLTAEGLAAALTGLVWVLVDRLLAARQLDKNSLPARPEYFNFDVYDHPMHLDEVGGRTLAALSYVVFDTETTGLRPSKGDEIISIAGVRVTDGKIDTGKPFTRLINPGRKIPRASTRYHGITDDMVKDEAAIDTVLPQFRDFIGDAVLVAHNAAFDMKFLKLKEEATGVVIDNLVLDSLLLSAFLEAESGNHGLDAVAERLGVDAEGRHTALGDSLTTARVFLRMLDMLEARGITTLRQAIDACSALSDMRRMQEQF